jgi:hypothetical protein
MFDKRSARREIEKRNRLRAKAKLPLVSVEEELRRCEEAAIQKERDDFVHRADDLVLSKAAETGNLSPDIADIR